MTIELTMDTKPRRCLYAVKTEMVRPAKTFALAEKHFHTLNDVVSRS